MLTSSECKNYDYKNIFDGEALYSANKWAVFFKSKKCGDDVCRCKMLLH